MLKISLKPVILGLSILSSTNASSVEFSAYDSCQRVASFRNNEDPIKWVAVCTEVLDANVSSKARNELDTAEFCIAERKTTSELSAIGPYSDPVGTKYFSSFGRFNNSLARTQAVDFLQYQGNPNGKEVYPLNEKVCSKSVKKPFWGRQLNGACDQEDRLLMYGSFFNVDYYLNFDKTNMELLFEQVNHELNSLALPVRYTAIKGSIRCESLD